MGAKHTPEPWIGYQSEIMGIASARELCGEARAPMPTSIEISPTGVSSARVEVRLPAAMKVGDAMFLPACAGINPAAVQELVELARHVAAMADDAYLTGHPEWDVISSEAILALVKAKEVS